MYLKSLGLDYECNSFAKHKKTMYKYQIIHNVKNFKNQTVFNIQGSFEV
jgi:hypothetical protein